MRVYSKSIREVGDHYANIERWKQQRGRCVMYRATRIEDGIEVVLKSYGEDAFNWRPYQSIPFWIAPLEAVARGPERLAVMRFVPGETLAELVARGPVPRRQAIAIVEAIADDLAGLHSCGYVHLRVDPTHVIVPVDPAQGAACLLSLDGVVVDRNQPVDVRRASVAGRVDLFAAGVMLFELLAGRPPTEVELGEGADGHARQRARAPRLPAPLDQDAALGLVIARALARDPSDRFLSADALRDACAALDPEHLPRPARSGLLPISPRSWGFVGVERLPGGPRGDVTHQATRIADGGIVWLEPTERPPSSHRDEPPIQAELPPHPSILVAREQIVHDDATWSVLDEAPGDTLASLIAAGPVPPRRSLEIVAAMADALAHLHARGIVYGGIDPTCVIVRPAGTEGPLIGLLGVDDSHRRARQHLRGGCCGPGALVDDQFRYASPEGVLEHRIGPAADVFGVGIVLCEALTGQHPYADENLMECLRQMMVARLPELPEAIGRIRDLPELVARALARDPADRFTAIELRDAATAIAQRLPIEPAS